MSMDNPAADEILDIEIGIDGAQKGHLAPSLGSSAGRIAGLHRAPGYRERANEVQLDCTGAMSAETVTAWLSAVTKS
jgi:hypothetical protein